MEQQNAESQSRQANELLHRGVWHRVSYDVNGWARTRAGLTEGDIAPAHQYAEDSRGVKIASKAP